MTNKTQIEARITAMEAELKALRADLAAADKHWPQVGEAVWFDGGMGSFILATWNDSVYQRHMFDIGVVYPSERDWEIDTRRRKVTTRLKRAAEAEGVKLDWKNVSQLKYFAYYSYIDREWRPYYHREQQHQGAIYFAKRETLEAVMKELGAEMDVLL